MLIRERAMPIKGWNLVKDGLPEIGTVIEILHFGNNPDARILDTATVDRWGIYPHNKNGGHRRQSTVTHWRLPVKTGESGRG